MFGEKICGARVSGTVSPTKVRPKAVGTVAELQLISIGGVLVERVGWNERWRKNWAAALAGRAGPRGTQAESQCGT